MNEDIYDGSACPSGCGSKLTLPPTENCSCHTSPPCSACVDKLLICPECGWEEGPQGVTVPASSAPSAWAYKKPDHDLGGGKRVYDYDYDSSSGSTMRYTGKYQGPVTKEDIIALLGSGTFGHRGPMLYENGTFTYTKITD